MTSEDANQQRSINRRIIIIAAVISAGLTLFHILSMIRVLQLPDTFNTSLSIPLELLANGVWSVLFGLVTVALVRYKPYAFWWISWLLLTYAVYFVIRLAIFAQADYDRQRIPFLITGIVLISGIAVIIRKTR